MPNKPSTRKRVRQNEKRRAHNRALRSTMRTAVKKANTAIASKDVAELDTLVREAQARLGKAAKTGLIKKNNMSRKQSRLMKKAAQARNAAQSAGQSAGDSEE